MRKLLAALSFSLLLFAACGDDDPVDDLAASPGVSGDIYGQNSTPASTESTGGIQAGGDCEDRSGSGGQALIELEDNKFTAPCVQMSTEQGFQIKNNGSNTHNFSVEGVQVVDVDLTPGQENNTENPGIDAGTYKMFCKFHRSGGMEGELRVVEA